MNPYEGLSEEYPQLYEAFDQLNDYQKKAAIDDHKATLLNAHVGSGKTTVILHKVLYQIIKIHNILFNLSLLYSF